MAPRRVWMVARSWLTSSDSSWLYTARRVWTSDGKASAFDASKNTKPMKCSPENIGTVKLER